jgi:lipoprotein NlpI
MDSTNSVGEYARIRIWLIRARLGRRQAATEELQTYLAQLKSGKLDDWPAKVISYLTGALTESKFFQAVPNTDKKVESQQQCEACFYTATKRLIGGDKAAAGNYFEKCVAAGNRDSDETFSAAAELQFMRNSQ